MGQDPDWLIDRYAWMLNEAIKDRPADMLIGMHMCRGNFRSTYAASGGYDAAADAIFNKTGVDIYFMEYDTDRAGGLEPLKLLPKGKKRVMAGFITTKHAELESIDDLKRKFDESIREIIALLRHVMPHLPPAIREEVQEAPWLSEASLNQVFDIQQAVDRAQQMKSDARKMRESLPQSE